MLDLKNRTPFVAAIVPFLDKHGVDHATVVVKGTFDLGRHGDELPVSERQAELADLLPVLTDSRGAQAVQRLHGMAGAFLGRKALQ